VGAAGGRSAGRCRSAGAGAAHVARARLSVEVVWSRRRFARPCDAWCRSPRQWSGLGRTSGARDRVTRRGSELPDPGTVRHVNDLLRSACDTLILCRMNSDVRAARWWLIACIAAGLAMVALYPGGYFEDPAIHFLRARWMWTHPWMAVDVWDRPLFTLIYSIPANLPGSGFMTYLAGKVTTVAISGVTAWLTYELARAYQLERPALAIPLMWLQPCVFVLSSQTTPEPLFALLVVVVLWLRQQGRVVAGLTVASLLTVVRPEGFLLLPVWAWWAAADPRSPHSKWGRVAVICTLVIAPALWWYLAAQITLDPLFPVHNWPSLFIPLRAVFTREAVRATLQGDVGRLSEILGVLLVVPFFIGLVIAVRRRETALAAVLVIVVFCGHLLVGASGVFGWAPIPSAFACVAPALALVVLTGWNAIVEVVSAISNPRLLTFAAAFILSIALLGDVAFADGLPGSREWRPILDAMTSFATRPRLVTSFVWSQAYADVLIAHDPMENPLRFGDRAGALSSFARATPGTLVQWDDRVGPASFGLTAHDIEGAGFVTSYHRADALRGWLPPDSSSRAMATIRSLLRLAPDQVHRTETWLLSPQSSGSGQSTSVLPQSVAR
jgi:hypothetical protein